MATEKKETKKAATSKTPLRNKATVRSVGRDSDLLVIRASLQRLAIIEEFKVGFISEDTAKGRILKINEQIARLGRERGFIEEEEVKGDE